MENKVVLNYDIFGDLNARNFLSVIKLDSMFPIQSKDAIEIQEERVAKQLVLLKRNSF